MIKKPLTTEKAIRLIELENIIVFEVDSKDTRTNIKKGVEKIFNIKVDKVNVLNKGSRKIAYVKLNKKNKIFLRLVGILYIFTFWISWTGYERTINSVFDNQTIPAIRTFFPFKNFFQFFLFLFLAFAVLIYTKLLGFSPEFKNKPINLKEKIYLDCLADFNRFQKRYKFV